MKLLVSDVNLVLMALMACMLMDIMHNQLHKNIIIKFAQVGYNVSCTFRILFKKRVGFHFDFVSILDNNVTDIDECRLGLANCGYNSFCENTIGSFSCHCNKGTKFCGLIGPCLSRVFPLIQYFFFRFL